MLQPECYRMARHQARFHVVVEILAAKLLGKTPGPLQIESRVVEVFRGTESLKPGDPVEFIESVMRPGEDIPCGGTIWKTLDDVHQARYIEAFLEGNPPECAVALWQSQVVPAPQGRPRMDDSFPLTAPAEHFRKLVPL